MQLLYYLNPKFQAFGHLLWLYKTQISFAVTTKLNSAFVFATWIVHFLYYLNPKFQAFSHLLWLYSPVCAGPGRKSRRPVFSQRGSYMSSVSRKPAFCIYENKVFLHWVRILYYMCRKTLAKTKAQITAFVFST